MMAIKCNIPLITVVLPVFNAEKYLREAINSILGQTFKNFELILINDGSTDSSLKILEYFKGIDERIILISRENRGLVETLNEGIRLARGEWIARMDADDIALANRFECQLQWLAQTGADICGSWIKLFGTRDNRVLKYSQADGAIKMEMLFGSPFAHPTVIMRASLVRELLYDKAWEKCEDYELWERMARIDCKMTNFPAVLLLYRQHNTQISVNSSVLQQRLTQKVRRRYWCYVFNFMNLNLDWIDEVLKLREPSPIKSDMDKVDAAFGALLEHSQVEARGVIFDHVTRLYFRAAFFCPDVVQRWEYLNKNWGGRSVISVKIKLYLLHVFKVHPSSSVYQRLKTLYFTLIR